MSVVVSDATPINILVRISQIDLLPRLFERVIIPPSVVAELGAPLAPTILQSWIKQRPTWLDMLAPSVTSTSLKHRGEEDAIVLAQELGIETILLDERNARKRAEARGLRAVGTIGILEVAADAGWIAELSVVHQRLRETDFRTTEALLDESLARHLKRKS